MASPYGDKGLKRLVKATQYSWQGLSAAFQHEEAFRQEVILAVITIPLALYFGESAIERALMISAVILILIVELLNSGIEAITDRVSLEKHELAKRAKDIGSAAVMLSLINAAVIWVFLLLN